MPMTPEARREAARKAVATRKARASTAANVEAVREKALSGTAGSNIEPLPKDKRCNACLRARVRQSWVCSGCGLRFCEHGMNPYLMRVDGSGFCKRCGRSRESFAAMNERLVRLGLSPLDPPEPAPRMAKAA